MRDEETIYFISWKFLIINRGVRSTDTVWKYTDSDSNTVRSLGLVVPWVNFPSGESKFILMHLGQLSMNFLNCLLIAEQSTQVIPLLATCRVWERLKWLEVSRSWFLRINILWLLSNILFKKLVSLLDTTGTNRDPNTLVIAVLSYLVQRSTIPLMVVVFSFVLGGYKVLEVLTRVRNANFKRVGLSSCPSSIWFTVRQFFR